MNGVVNSVSNPATLTQGATSISYEYDAQQQRLKQTTAGNTIVYLNDPVTGIGSELHPGSGSTWHDYLQADGERIGLRISTTSPTEYAWN